MSREQCLPRSGRCEREQGAGAPRSGDATVREPLAATGKNSGWRGKTYVVWRGVARNHDGGDCPQDVLAKAAFA